jgi:hypothetical protein
MIQGSLPLVLSAALAAAPFIVAAPEHEAERILERYEELRPTEAELAMYRLDWADSLSDALKRSKKEKRPVLLVIIHARYGDITSGHC